MKYRLLAPGPTPVPDRVRAAMGGEMIHHRTPAFEKIFASCREGLSYAYQTKHDVLILACSGTGGMEAAFQNFFSPGDTVINVGGGKFAERWGKMAAIFGLNVVSIEVPWGQSAQASQVEQALQQHPNTRGVVCVASETSTGVRHPYEAIGSLVRKKDNCIFIVDAITALGVWDMSPERDGIDILVSGSQKAFMLPPGLAFVSISPKAWEQQKTAKNPRYYFDLAKEKKAQATNQTAYTPAVSLIIGLSEALKMMKEEGLANIFARHARMAQATRAGVQAMGLALFAQTPSESVTSVLMPSQIKPDSVYTGLANRFNLTIAGGQDQLKGKIFRIAHMGYFDELDVITVLSAVEMTLIHEGYTQFTPGAGVGAAQLVFTG